ncbi:MAG: hypothetical protein AAGA65_26065 [Actinomycetota bacterium]
MLSTKPVDTRNLTFRYSGTAEHYEYDRETEKRATTQTRDKNTGYPVWKIRCVAVYRAAGEHGEISVTVPHPEPPTAEFDTEISFTDMTVKDWVMNNQSGQTWHAETFTAAHPVAPPAAGRARKAEAAAPAS